MDELDKIKANPSSYILTPPILHAYHVKFNDFPKAKDGKYLTHKCAVCKWDINEK